MKVLVIGTTGFIGRSVREYLGRNGYDVHVANRSIELNEQKSYKIDLLDKDSIAQALTVIRPDIIVSCAGVVDPNGDLNANVLFTQNLLEVISDMELKLARIIISGSAGEYGPVDSLPVSEDTPLRATSPYGLSKIEEEEVALNIATTHTLPVVVARIFNPIGLGMKDKFLIPNLLKQIDEYKAGSVNEITLGRLDSKRDYISVEDISRAFVSLIEGDPKHTVYNVGSGISTTNGQILDKLLQHNHLSSPTIRENSDTVEPMMAVQADIRRMESDFDWRPTVSLDKTIEEIVNERKK